MFHNIWHILGLFIVSSGDIADQRSDERYGMYGIATGGVMMRCYYTIYTHVHYLLEPLARVTTYITHKT